MLGSIQTFTVKDENQWYAEEHDLVNFEILHLNWPGILLV
jgi:hypothetical protein